VQKLVAEEGGSRWKTWLAELGVFAQALFSLPRKLDRLVARMEQGNLEVRTPDLKKGVDRLDRSVNRVAGAVILAALLLGAVQLYIAGEYLPAGILFGAAVLAFLWVLR